MTVSTFRIYNLINKPDICYTNDKNETWIRPSVMKILENIIIEAMVGYDNLFKPETVVVDMHGIAGRFDPTVPCLVRLETFIASVMAKVGITLAAVFGYHDKVINDFRVSVEDDVVVVEVNTGVRGT